MASADQPAIRSTASSRSPGAWASTASTHSPARATLPSGRSTSTAGWALLDALRASSTMVMVETRCIRPGSIRGARGSVSRCVGDDGLGPGLPAEPDGEPGAAGRPAAVRLDDATVCLDDVLDDREADAEAGVLARHRGRRLTERLEQERQELGGDAPAAVADVDHDLGVRQPRGDGDRAVLRRELHRVR